MPSIDQTKKAFILGSIALGVLMIVGIVWAVAADINAGNGGQAPTFNDANDPTSGKADAKVTVRIFSDFQCPACRQAEDGVQYAMKTYGDRVRFVWDDFPLQAIHSNALLAADAARAAEAQGKFWEYQQRLYDDQPSWETLPDPTQKFVAYAQALDLDVKAFTDALTNRTYQDKVMSDLDEGQKLGIDGTPVFFIDDKRIVGAMDNATWDKEIQAALNGT